MGASLTDLELVQRVQSGDKKSFDILVLKYQHKVIGVITRYVHDPDTAMDVAQEAFIKAYRGLKNFRGESAFYTWLYRIAINSAKNYLVSQNRRLPDSDIDAEEAEQIGGESALKEYASPEHEMLKDEIQAAVLDVKLSHLEEDIAARKDVARYYIEHIHNPRIVLPTIEDWDANVFHIFPVRCVERDRLQQYLAQRDIQTIIHYPIPPHKQECYKEWNELTLPITEKIHNEELSLPMSPVMTEKEIKEVVEAINYFK